MSIIIYAENAIRILQQMVKSNFVTTQISHSASTFASPEIKKTTQNLQFVSVWREIIISINKHYPTFRCASLVEGMVSIRNGQSGEYLTCSTKGSSVSLQSLRPMPHWWQRVRSLFPGIINNEPVHEISNNVAF